MVWRGSVQSGLIRGGGADVVRFDFGEHTILAPGIQVVVPEWGARRGGGYETRRHGGRWEVATGRGADDHCHADFQ